ncbi:MAG: hypothetical protein WAU32_13340, partial [Thermoanaerobaculia bacterium]
MRKVLARFALGLALVAAGWALAEAIASRRAMNAASERSELVAGDSAANSRVIAFADPDPTGRKAGGPRRSAKRPGTESPS